jgi:hypothetical protein
MSMNNTEGEAFAERNKACWEVSHFAKVVIKEIPLSQVEVYACSIRYVFVLQNSMEIQYISWTEFTSC